MARAEWRLQRVQWRPEHLIFLDEPGLNTKMTRLYGRAAGGARCACQVPHGHWQTATFIAGLRCDRLTAPMLVDGPMDGPIFLAYVEQFLAPELAAGDVVVCDNLASHKVKGVREAIAARGAELQYLPAYSPDLNPIEMAHAKLKAALRQSARRSFDGLAGAVTSALDGFSSTICHNFFRHAGYATD